MGVGGVVLGVSLVLFLVPLMHTCIFVYRMGRLCGGAHEISSIPAPFCLWVGGGRVHGVGVGGGGSGVGGVIVRVGVVWWGWVGAWVGWWCVI